MQNCCFVFDFFYVEPLPCPFYFSSQPDQSSVPKTTYKYSYRNST